MQDEESFNLGHGVLGCFYGANVFLASKDSIIEENNGFQSLENFEFFEIFNCFTFNCKMRKADMSRFEGRYQSSGDRYRPAVFKVQQKGEISWWNFQELIFNVHLLGDRVSTSRFGCEKEAEENREGW